MAQIASEQRRLAQQLDRLPGANPQLVLESNFFGYVETVLVRTIGSYQQQTRLDVQKAASEMFTQLIRDPEAHGVLQIATDFRVDLLDTHGNPRETSEGGKQLVALALIGALKHAAVRGGPVVLDSPLARLDLDHRANVLTNWLPALGTQAILLVQSGELTTSDAHSHLGSMIAHEYRITRPTGDVEYAAIERTQ